MRRALTGGVAGCLASACLLPSAAAQQAAPFASARPYLPTSVSDLLAPGSRRTSAGVRVGAFTLLPEAGASIVYDDNVLAAPSEAKGDFYTGIDAGVAFVSNWSRHALELYAGGGGHFYADLDSEDVGYATIGAAGRLDVTKDLWLTTFARYALGYEPRGSGESFQRFEEPIERRSFDLGLLAHKHFNRLWAEVAGTVHAEAFSDGRLSAGGVTTVVDQSFRDGTVNDLIGRVGYDLSAKTAVFAEGRLQARDYDDDRFDGTGLKALAGVRHEITRLVSAEGAVGFMHYEPDGPFATIDTWTYRAQLRYDASPLMTVALVGSRDVGSPSQAELGSNRIHSDLGIRADYAIRRNVTVMAGAGFGTVDYVDGSRDDDFLRFTAGAEYRVLPWLSLWSSFDRLRYESNAVPDLDYDKSVVTFGVMARY